MKEAEIHITRDKKVKKGKGGNYNTMIIQFDKIQDKGYRNELLKQIEIIERKIDGLRSFNYTGERKRKVIEKVNDAPVYDGCTIAMIGAVKRNERELKELKRLRDLLK